MTYKFRLSPYAPTDFDPIPRFVLAPAHYSGKNDKKLRAIILQEARPGSRAARVAVRGMRKGVQR